MIGVNPLYVGIDLGATRHVVQTMDLHGQLVSRCKVANDLTGVEALVQQVVQAAARVGADAVRIGMEATNLYWWHLYQALAEHPALAPLQPQLAVLNPKVIHGFKGIYPDLGKTDNLDARIIADCLRFGRVRYTPPPDFRYAALQRPTRFRFH